MLQILFSSVKVKLLARAKLIFLREQPDFFFFCGEPWFHVISDKNIEVFETVLLAVVPDLNTVV